MRDTGQYQVVELDWEVAEAEFEKTGEGDLVVLAKAAADNRLKTDSSRWFGFYVCALLFGGAAGGLVFGRIGDRFGRVKGMTAAICCYSGMSLIAYTVNSPTELFVMRLLVCMGMGGMWPNGVALMSEVWSGVSRPLLAGVIGALGDREPGVAKTALRALWLIVENAGAAARSARGPPAAHPDPQPEDTVNGN